MGFRPNNIDPAYGSGRSGSGRGRDGSLSETAGRSVDTGAVEQHPEPAVGLDDVAELRSILRRPDVAARRVGLALLRTWSDLDLDATGARAVLEASGGAYPAIDGDPEHPGELLVQLLWGHPQLVAVPDLLRVYLIADERTRRGLLHLLAIRGGDEGLAGLEHLFGQHSPDELLPVPTEPLLEPLLSHPESSRVTRLLSAALAQPGWTWHAADLLRRMDAARHGDVETRRDLLDAASSSAQALVESCNRSMASKDRQQDPARSAREALASLLRLLDDLEDLDQHELLLGLLSSADPRVGAMGAARLVARGVPIAPERTGLISRDPVARADLHDELRSLKALDPENPELDGVELAEGELTRWLAGVTELGRAPDEMEFVTSVSGAGSGPGPFHLFRFRVRSPHWSAARGWMIGVGGACTASCYVAEDEGSPAHHVSTVQSALDDWPDRRADGAA